MYFLFYVGNLYHTLSRYHVIFQMGVIITYSGVSYCVYSLGVYAVCQFETQVRPLVCEMAVRAHWRTISGTVLNTVECGLGRSHENGKQI